MITTSRGSVTTTEGTAGRGSASVRPDVRRKLLELAEVHGEVVRECALRPDGRQLRVFIGDEHLLQVSAWIRDDGSPALELDVLSLPGLGTLVDRRRYPGSRELAGGAAKPQAP